MEPFKILVAEDDRNIRSGLVDALELEGYVMEEAADGAGALRKFTAFRPDLVLLDVMMPNLNGYEVCRRIRRSDAATPIIMLTAKGEEIDKAGTRSRRLRDEALRAARAFRPHRGTIAPSPGRNRRPASFRRIRVRPVAGGCEKALRRNRRSRRRTDHARN